MSEKNAKMLERVRALLAKADDKSVTPQEAESFRAKADALMAQYAIDQWMVDAAQAGVNERPKPEIRYFNFSWWSTSEHRDTLWTMFQDAANHCRCVVAVRGQGSNGEWGKMPVIGLPSDLDYFDLLFTDLMLQMGKQLEPSPDPNGELGEEVYLLRQAGQPWERITEQIFNVGLVTPTKKEVEKVEAHRDRWRGSYAGNAQPETGEPITWRELKASDVWTDMKNRLANANRRYVKAHGLQEERNYVKPGVYRRSFAIGFVEEVGHRFREMVREQRTTQTGSMEVALVDIRQSCLNLYAEMFPPPKPDPKAKHRKYVEKSVRVDYDSINAGRKAGREADLQGHQGRRVAGQKGLPQG